jgi:hypothetical protein
MTKNILTMMIACLVFGQAFSQTFDLKGVITDESSETLVGATVLDENGKATVSDLDGNYVLKLSKGKHKVTISYVGFEAQTSEVIIDNADVSRNFILKSKTALKEIEIVADVARNRQTPVAFSTISIKQIQQELGTRDLPMVLNSTPGVYATESGGGSGDSRINIRGFDQKNVAVMIDGVPFNDMENGAVFWSNWEGLGDVTGNMQVQRGLGASKLALPSVGGTINVLTKGIDQKAGGTLKQEIGNNNSLRTALSYNTGILSNGVGITAAVSARTADGWANQTWLRSYTYFLKVQKRFAKHFVSVTVNGANQTHAQRTNQYSMAVYDKAYALNHGISQGFYDSLQNIENKLDNGLRYNRQWGTYIDANGKKVIVNEKINFYTKPVFSLSDYYTINDKLTLSNVAYLSVGTGGGTTMQNIPAGPDSITGQYNYQGAYNANVATGNASTYNRASFNNHFWYGLLSTLNYKINKKFHYQIGADLRSYKGGHYQSAYDLIGGTYYNDVLNNNQPKGPFDQEFQIKKKGDKVGYDYDGFVKWAGAFTQLEYKFHQFSAFVNLTTSYSNYNRTDYFAKRDLVLSDTTYLLALGYGDTITRAGKKYTFTSPESRYAKAPEKNYLGYTFKTGGNYNINDFNNVFVNVGYMKLAPRFTNVFDKNNRVFSDVDYQYVKAIELGYGYKQKKFSINLNAYYTVWKNKPPDFAPSKTVEDPITGGQVVLYYNINGLDALHKGVELDGLYKINKKLSVMGVISLGDWIYTSAKKYTILDQNGNPAIDATTGKQFGVQTFSAIGVHVGNAAQVQYSATVNYEPIEDLYFKARFTYFDKNYASFDPTTLDSVNANRESWKMPGYGMLDLFAGYNLKVGKKYGINFGASVTNTLNAVFITDAQNNGLNTRTVGGYDAKGALISRNIGSRFNAESAGVFFGQGRRFNISIKFTF